MTKNDNRFNKQDFKYDEQGRCIAAPDDRGLRALGTNARAKARNKWALRNWKRRRRREKAAAR